MIECPRQIILQVFGSLMRRPALLSETDKYQLEVSDFPRLLDKYIYAGIYNLFSNGAEVIHIIDLDNYFESNPAAKATFEQENGIKFLQDCEEFSDVSNFNLYYGQLKKISLLRDLQKNGNDISNFYCENPLDPDYSKINSQFEELTTQDIINNLKGEIATLENKYSNNTVVEEMWAADGIRSLLEDLKIKPEVGALFQGNIFNTISRGARLGKLYLRSAGSGVGKSRTMIGDCCTLAYPIRYDRELNQWVSTGSCEKVLYIATEQDIAEIQTMILAYLTGINEEVFLYGNFEYVDMDIILKAIDLMEQYKYNFALARIADPCTSVVKNIIRKYNFQYSINYCFYDYIFSSPAMLNEYRDLKLREDVALRLFTTALKNLAVELNMFILTSTQISNDDENGGFKDYHYVQGSKAIVNLTDLACVMSRPSLQELKEMSDAGELMGKSPNIVIDIYKNRRGRWTQVRIWGRNDLGTCRRDDLFVTTPDNKIITEFSVVHFDGSLDSNDYGELLDLFNNGVVPNEKSEQLLNNFVDMVEASQLAHQEKEDDFYITNAFENKIDKYKQIKTRDWDELL